MNNYERWLAELESRVGGVIDNIFNSPDWTEYIENAIDEDQDSVNILVRQWEDCGVNPENESDVATLLAHRLVHAEVGGNDPGNQGDGYFGYFIIFYRDHLAMENRQKN